MPLASKADFLRRYSHTAEEFSATCLQWNDLRRIHSLHEDSLGVLTPIASLVADTLFQSPGIHTVGSRIKDPEHLIDKIIRKSRADKGVWATASNYHKVVTDLVGVRGLYLLHSEWPAIDAYIRSKWPLKRRPEAIVQPKDPDRYKDMFRRAGCKIVQRLTGYRSVHYLVRLRPDKTERIVEIQVRSLFEQAASEVDHRVRYPRLTKNQVLDDLVANVHEVAALGDEFSAMAATLLKFLQAQQAGRSGAQLAAFRKELAQGSQRALSLSKKLLGLDGMGEIAFAEMIHRLNSSATSPLPPR